MLVRLATSRDFFRMFPQPLTVYDTEAFIRLNACKMQAVRHFVGYDDEVPRMGITLGYDGEQWRAPFSAPFSAPVHNGAPSPERAYDFFSELTDTLQQPWSLTLPPRFYSPDILTVYEIVLANMAQKGWQDYNYHYDLSKAADYEGALDRRARNKYRQALKAGFAFEADAPLDRAYAVIEANRRGRGYPLAMSYEQVKATIAPDGPVKARCFLLTLGQADVAAALVYDAAPAVAQVIYWGDAPGYSELRPMNLLPKYVMEYYLAAGRRILDIGPSSSHGVPSIGLCRFKESLGCTLTPKPTFQL